MVERTKQILETSDPATPMFLYLSLQSTHGPHQVWMYTIREDSL